MHVESLYVYISGMEVILFTSAYIPLARTSNAFRHGHIGPLSYALYLRGHILEGALFGIF